MTPKDKAIELVENFSETLPKRVYGNLIEQDWISAKRCALIAVEEILEIVSSDESMLITELQFWQQVKQEIENL
jgi:hypothetical protein